MKESVLLPGLLVAVLGLSGCIDIASSWRTVAGSGQVGTETRQVSNFDDVGVAGSGELTVIQGEEESLTIEADDNLLPLIKTEVSNGHLRIGPENVNLRPTRTIRYQLKLKHLRGLQLSGSLKADLGQLQTDNLKVGISGSGKVRIAKLEAKDFSAQVSGSGDISVTGRVEQQKLGISGSGDLQAADLESQQAAVHISGSGHAKLWVKKGLEVHISGSGTVEYYGNPQVDSHASGSGRVRRLADR